MKTYYYIEKRNATRYIVVQSWKVAKDTYSGRGLATCDKLWKCKMLIAWNKIVDFIVPFDMVTRIKISLWIGGLKSRIKETILTTSEDYELSY